MIEDDNTGSDLTLASTIRTSRANKGNDLDNNDKKAQIH
jgi:hypothetical protein